jgi:hypothetical protein
MKALQIPLAAAVAVCLSSSAFADVKLTIQNGRVSLVAKDATVRQILTEWARVGQTKIINVERIPGGPQTLELTNVSETEALEILLRSISGFMVAPRAVTAAANASQFDRIVVMPTPAAPRPPVAAAATPAAQPVFQQPQLPQPVDDDVDDERPAGAVPVPMAQQPQRGPIFNQFPPPQVINPQTGQVQVGVAQPFNQGQPMVQPQPVPQQPSAVPTASPFGGVAVPGMVAPVPQQPGQPVQIIQQPGQPRRPGGPEGPHDF